MGEFDEPVLSEILNGKFDEVMHYTQEFDAITDIEAFNNPKKHTIVE